MRRSDCRRAWTCISCRPKWARPVQMIQDHYGHMTPVKNADRILKACPDGSRSPPRPRFCPRPAAWMRKRRRIEPSSRRARGRVLIEPESHTDASRFDAAALEARSAPLRRWRSGLGAISTQTSEHCKNRPAITVLSRRLRDRREGLETRRAAPKVRTRKGEV